MSSYEQYARTSQHYDLTRRPVGWEIIAGLLVAQDHPAGRLELLDAGCGTGSYAQTLVPYTGRITGVDGNAGMLERAGDKLGDEVAAGHVTLLTAQLTDLPLADASFDAVMINQVLHHLPDDPVGGWPMHRAVLAELARVLRPGGLLVITTASQDQLRQGYWYYELVRPAAERLRSRYIPLETLAAMLADLGLPTMARTVPLDAVLQAEAYFDATGPLEQPWRDGDSVWALATADERESALDRLRRLDADGRAQDFLVEHDAPRSRVGQVTIAHASRH